MLLERLLNKVSVLIGCLTLRIPALGTFSEQTGCVSAARTSVSITSPNTSASTFTSEFNGGKTLSHRNNLRTFNTSETRRSRRRPESSANADDSRLAALSFGPKPAAHVRRLYSFYCRRGARCVLEAAECRGRSTTSLRFRCRWVYWHRETDSHQQLYLLPTHLVLRLF